MFNLIIFDVDITLFHRRNATKMQLSEFVLINNIVIIMYKKENMYCIDQENKLMTIDWNEMTSKFRNGWILQEIIYNT